MSTKGEANCLQQRFAIAWFSSRIGGDRLGFPQKLWALYFPQEFGRGDRFPQEFGRAIAVNLMSNA